MHIVNPDPEKFAGKFAVLGSKRTKRVLLPRTRAR